MKRRNMYKSVFDANRFILFCVIFTVSMIITMMLEMLIGGMFYLNIFDFFAIIIFCAAPVMALVLFDHTPGLKYFRDDRCNPWLGILANYLTSMGLIMLVVFVLGFFEPFSLHPHWSISRKIFVQYTPAYGVVMLGMVIIDINKIAKANGNLQKIKKHHGGNV